MLGLLLAMGALGGASFRHAETFLSDLETQKRGSVQSMFESKLMMIYNDKDVCKWLVEHCGVVQDTNLRLASYLCAATYTNKYGLLELSRVC